MRVLVLLRGAQGSGKDWFIREAGIEPYALSADSVRLMVQSPVLTETGDFAVSIKNDGKVWDILMSLLEERMARGEFCVVNGCHSKLADVTRYNKLATKYRYRIYWVDLTGVPIDVCKRRNADRQVLHRVPDDAIERCYARFETEPLGSRYSRLEPYPEAFRKQFGLSPLDFNKYRKVVVIGDIHGCFEPLREFGTRSEDTCYIFVGDYTDRGIQNAEVVKFLLEICQEPNVVLLEGNHEKHLRTWADGGVVFSREFNKCTKAQLESAGIDKKAVRVLCNKFAQLAHFKLGDIEVLVTHAGISRVPDGGLYFVATDQFIHGVGPYELDIDSVFCRLNKNPNLIQIHGHRNTDCYEITSHSNSFNLEGKVEFGESLRVVQFVRGDNGVEIFPREIPNSVYDKELTSLDFNSEFAKSAVPLITRLRNVPGVKETKHGDISSFAFTNKTFTRGAWDYHTIISRGLFLHETGRFVIRSYNKFFNVNEVPDTRIQTIRAAYEFPLRSYVKYNGFLGLIGFDETTGQVIVASKNSIDGPFAKLFRDTLVEVGSDMDAIQRIVAGGCSLACEVLHPADPHIIEYTRPHVVLLDVIAREEEFKCANDDLLEATAVACKLGFKKPGPTVATFKEFLALLHSDAAGVLDEFAAERSPRLEGLVFVDAVGRRVKFKTAEYRFWKGMRAVKDQLSGGHEVSTGGLLTPLAIGMYAWMKRIPRDELKTKSIIELRNSFLAGE